MTELIADHTEFFKQFSDNQSFRQWLSANLFTETYNPGGAAPKRPESIVMRITAVDSVIVPQAGRSYVYVLVRTDAGLTGLGEATLMGRERLRARGAAGFCRPGHR